MPGGILGGATGEENFTKTNFERIIIGQTWSFTLEMPGNSHIQYCNRDDEDLH